MSAVLDWMLLALAVPVIVTSVYLLLLTLLSGRPELPPRSWSQDRVVSARTSPPRRRSPG
jgi:hypothetical protein